MASYLYATGFEHIFDLKTFALDAPQSKWGYADDVMAEEFIALCRRLEQAESPYFAVWQTLSSHEPFDVPYAAFEDKMLNSMAFADKCIEEVVAALEQSPEWDNTLLIITADHAYPYPYGTAASSVTRHRIPMLWLGGAVASPCEVESYGSQSDIAATLLTQLGCSTTDFPLSRNILDENIEHFGYYTFNNGFGTIDDEGVLIYDCTADTPITAEGDGSEQRQQRGETILQLTYKIINAL
jgi:phosphoglycerol transferase MdoB-like AlkP superfamily enzyme